MTDPALEPILVYLRKHVESHKMGELRQQLLEAGYERAPVDRAIDVFLHGPRRPKSAIPCPGLSWCSRSTSRSWQP